MQLKFEFEKETKGTYRFKEVRDDPAVGTLYIRKSAAKEIGFTGKGGLTVTIETEGGSND